MSYSQTPRLALDLRPIEPDGPVVVKLTSSFRLQDQSGVVLEVTPTELRVIDGPRAAQRLYQIFLAADRAGRER